MFLFFLLSSEIRLKLRSFEMERFFLMNKDVFIYFEVFLNQLFSQFIYESFNWKFIFFLDFSKKLLLYWIDFSLVLIEFHRKLIRIGWLGFVFLHFLHLLIHFCKSFNNTLNNSVWRLAVNVKILKDQSRLFLNDF